MTDADIVRVFFLGVLVGAFVVAVVAAFVLRNLSRKYDKLRDKFPPGSWTG